MARYIDADKLLSNFDNLEVKTHGTRRIDIAQSKGIEWVLRHVVPAEINDAPTVDAVEVVRCKDCISCYECVGGELRCDNSYEQNNMDRTVEPNWFCADGERKDDGKIH